MENTLPLSQADEKLVVRHKEILSKPIRIRLVQTDDDAGMQMKWFCDELQKLLPGITVKREPADDEPPGIHVSDNIHFIMVPKGEYLEIFLLSLLGHDALAGQDMGIDADELNRRVSLPVVLKMYVTENCPFCRKTLPKGLFLAGAAPTKIDFRIIDAVMFPALAADDNIRSAPTTLMDERFRWSGDFDMAEVVEMMAGRDPVQLGHETLKKMISDGGAEAAAALMDEYNTVIPAFTRLLAAEKWTERLGAMVAFEYLAEKNPEIAQKAIDGLWESFDAYDTAIMGDVLHLFGVLNQEVQIPRIQSVLDGQYPESVKKVAGEVLEALAGA